MARKYCHISFGNYITFLIQPNQFSKKLFLSLSFALKLCERERDNNKLKINLVLNTSIQYFLPNKFEINMT